MMTLSQEEQLETIDQSEISTMAAMLNGPKYRIAIDLDDARDFMILHPRTGKKVRAAHIVTINGVKFVIEAGKTQEVPKIVWDSLLESQIINPELMPQVKPITYDAQGNVLNYNMIPG